jgi:hypothetical protein
VPGGRRDGPVTNRPPCEKNSNAPASDLQTSESACAIAASIGPARSERPSAFAAIPVPTGAATQSPANMLEKTGSRPSVAESSPYGGMSPMATSRMITRISVSCVERPDVEPVNPPKGMQRLPRTVTVSAGKRSVVCSAANNSIVQRANTFAL